MNEVGSKLFGVAYLCIKTSSFVYPLVVITNRFGSGKFLHLVQFEISNNVRGILSRHLKWSRLPEYLPRTLACIWFQCRQISGMPSLTADRPASAHDKAECHLRPRLGFSCAPSFPSDSTLQTSHPPTQSSNTTIHLMAHPP